MSPEVVISGAGPAGMLLAYLLAGNGVRVRVLERHKDFRREFRGELVQPSMLGALEQLGLLPLLIQRGVARPCASWRHFVGARQAMRVSGGAGLSGGMFIQQSALLELLHELCGRMPGFRLDFGVTVDGLVRENGRVVALSVRGGAEPRIAGDVFVCCNGRQSALREEAGLVADSFQGAVHVLWLRFDLSGAPQAMPEGLEVHTWGRGVVSVLFPGADGRLKVAYAEPGDLAVLAKDLPELRRRLLPLLPEAVRAVVAPQFDERTERQVLKVKIDRLRKWWVPGLLFLGDAAHTMSPVGAQGLNLAMRDSIVAANHFIDALRAGRVPDGEVFQRIEAERFPEIETVQNFQVRAGRMVRAPRAAQQVGVRLVALLARVFDLNGKMVNGVTQVGLKHPVRLPAAPAVGS